MYTQGFLGNLHSRPELTLTAKRKLPYAKTFKIDALF